MNTGTMPQSAPSPVASYLLAVAAVALVALVRYSLSGVMDGDSPLMLFIGAVAFAAGYGGLKPGLLALALSLAVGDYLFLEPAYSLGVVQISDQIRIGIFVGVGLLVSGLCEALHRARRQAEAERQRLEQEIELRRDAEHAALEHEEQLTLALSATEMGTWRADLRTNTGTRDGNLNLILGLGEAPTTQAIDECFDRVLPDDRPRMVEAWNQAIAGRTLYLAEGRIKRPDGTQRWIREQGRPVGHSGEGPAFMTGVTLDITMRKQAEEAMRESQALLRLIIDSVPVLIAYIDTGFHYRLNNRISETWFGRPRAEITGRHVREVLGDKAWNRLRPNMERAAAGEIVSYKDRIPYRAGGSRWIHVNYVPNTDAQGKVLGFAALVHDITEYKRNEALLKDADRRKDEFLVMLAHELRNPLAALGSGLQIMQLKAAGPKNVARARDTMARQLNHVVRLIDDLLDISRIKRGKLELRREPLDLTTVVNQAVETCRPLLDAAGQTFTVSLPESPAYVRADEARVTQMLCNLLDNAAKYSEPGGCVSLSVERRGDTVQIRVADTGIGIPAHRLPHVFDMFMQAERAPGHGQCGLGIGLVMVRNLVEMHGGDIEARSQGEGRGSEFIVRLPALSVSELADLRSESPTELLSKEAASIEGTAPRRILVADDNKDAADSLGMLLGMSDNEVHVTYDGFEALEAAAAFRPDVVLLDLGMPGLDGFETARRLRVQPGGEQRLLIALTGWGQEDVRQRSREAGFNAHLTKPVDFAALEKLLGSSQTSAA